MAIPEPSCCDGPNELLRKILLGLPEISGGGGGGDVVIQDEGVTLTNTVEQINFVGAGVVATVVGNDVTVTIAGGGSSSVQSGNQAIGSGVDTISVVFPVAFAVAPDVIVSISRPVAENLIFANIDKASVTVAGFTASLGATTGSANYELTWIAN